MEISSGEGANKGFKTGFLFNSTQGGVCVISHALLSYLVFGASIFFFLYTCYIFTPSKLHHACQSILIFEETSKVTHNQHTRSRCGEIDLKCKGQQIPSARGLWTLPLQMHAPFQIKIPTVSSQHFITSIVSFHNHSTHCPGTKRKGGKNGFPLFAADLLKPYRRALKSSRDFEAILKQLWNMKQLY